MRTIRIVLLAAALGLTAVACGSSSGASDTSAETTAPEDARTDAAAVATGLADIGKTAAEVAAAAAIDKDKAVTLDEKIEPTWAKIEGTIKANDQDAYLAFEDAFATLADAAKAGDAAKAAGATGAIAKAITAYVAKYPG